MGIVDPKIAEALAFRQALSWLKPLKISQVFIELNSLNVVQAFHNSSKDSSYFKSIILDCSSIVKGLRSYSVYFVRRSTNVAAHTIANVREAISMTDREEWFTAPSFLIDVLAKDMQ